MVSGIKTATGEVHFATCRIYYDDPQPTLQRLADLHQRAIGSPGPFQTPIANSFSPSDAFHAYSDSSVALLAQLALASPAGHVAMLGEIVTAADRLGSISGLDGIFLSASRAAQYAGALPLLGIAADVFQSLGTPDQLGGGALTSAIFDVGTGLLSFVTGADISQAMAIGSSGWLAAPTLVASQLGVRGATAGLGGLDLLFSGSLAGLDGQAGSVGSGPPGTGVGPSPRLTGPTEESYAKAGAMLGGLAGGIYGWVTSGNPTGGAAGGAAGTIIGGGAGWVTGWAVETFHLDQPAAPDTGPYGPYGPFIGPYIGAGHGSRTATGTPIPAPTGTGTTPAPAGTGTTPAPAGTGTTPAPAGTGTTPAPAGTGTTPAPAGTGTTPAPAGTGTDDKKTIKPGESTKSPVDDGTGGSGGTLNASSGPGWFPARTPYGDGMATFAVWQRDALLLIGLPRFDDDGSPISDGFFPIESVATSGTPAHLVLRGRLVSPTADGRGRIGGGTVTPNMLSAGPSGKLIIPARVDGVSSYGAIDSTRALLETIYKFG